MTKTQVYCWPDGWSVSAVLDETRKPVPTGHGFEKAIPFVYVLAGPERDDRWFVAQTDPHAPAVMHPWAWGSPGWTPADVPKGEAQKRMLGFLLDLGVGRPDRGILASLVLQFTSGDNKPVATYLPYPRWVDDDRWDQRYEEAKGYVLYRTDTGHTEIEAGWDSAYLGLIQELELCSPDLPHPEATVFEKTRWHAMGSNGTISGSNLDELIDSLLEQLVILPASNQAFWEADHVIRGSWVSPSEDEVEVFRMLGEPLPWLWPRDKLMAWLGSRP